MPFRPPFRGLSLTIQIPSRPIVPLSKQLSQPPLQCLHTRCRPRLRRTEFIQHHTHVDNSHHHRPRPSDSPLHHRRPFHTTPRRHDSNQPKQTHYEILGVPVNVSRKELKQQFYTLSKDTHPDRNKTPHASERFAAISESYSVLADPEKRKRYDRDVMRGHPSMRAQHQGGAGGGQGGSYAGSRPASGLSKRRSAFKGPPPSYFAHGGGGAARAGGQQQQGQGQSDTTYSGGWGAEGPTASENLGAAYTTYDPEAGPFSTASVYRTQTVEDTRRKDRRAQALAEAYASVEDYEGNFWARFVVVTGIVVFGVTIGSLFVGVFNTSPRGNASGGSIQSRAGGLIKGDGSRRDGSGGGGGSGGNGNGTTATATVASAATAVAAAAVASVSGSDGNSSEQERNSPRQTKREEQEETIRPGEKTKQDEDEERRKAESHRLKDLERQQRRREERRTARTRVREIEDNGKEKAVL